MERLLKLKKNKGIDIVVLTSPAAVKYFSGYSFNFETGPSPFHLLPAALIGGDIFSLVLADNEMQPLFDTGTGITVRPYQSYVFEKPCESTRQFLGRIHDVLGQWGGRIERVGIEQDSLPFVVAQSLTECLPDAEFIDIGPDISQMRVVKDNDEIAAIRRAAELADIGQSAVLKYARPGMSELELFAKVRLEMESAAGTRVPMMTDLVSGVRTATGGGNPSNRIIGENELVLCDLTPCLNGYWGDSCNTIVVGTATAEQKRIFTLVRSALRAGIDTIRPGIPAKTVDAVMRKILAPEGGFGHHGGHGVGLIYHEEPRIVPYNDRVLEAGMVIALEPAVYKSDWGIRLEHLVLVTTDGAEVLTKFDHVFGQV